MIISFLIGGLGNQMFQYALARNLSIKNLTTLKLDIGYFDAKFSINHLRYSLNHFNIQEEFVRIEDLMQANLKKVEEKEFGFKDNILKLQGNIFLSGYWENEQYFKENEDVIRQDFLLRQPLGEKSKIVKNMIRDTVNPVSVHFRRGYAKDPCAKDMIGVLPIRYYQDAFRIMRDRVGACTAFVFSDDIIWVKKYIDFEGFKDVHYIMHNDEKTAYEDMYLMSQCRHHIIANSTFSWWGAWLNPDFNKLVIGPKLWTKCMHDASSIQPNGWLQVENSLL